VYHPLVQLLDISEYKHSGQENKANDDALAKEDSADYLPTQEVIQEAKQKFPNT